MQIRNEQEIPNSIVIPSQWRAMHEPGFVGAQKLLFAVLSEAFKTYHGGKNRPTVSSKRIFEEAKAWFWDDTWEGWGSILFCCHHLNIDLNYLRRNLIVQETIVPVLLQAEPPFIFSHPAWAGNFLLSVEQSDESV